MCCRTAQKASAYYWMECLCQCQATRNGRLCHIHQVFTSLFLIHYDYKYYNLYFLLFRNERNQLLLGIRHATRPQTIVPSSMLSSDSMHIGLLAAAAHAAATNSCFTVFYHPRLNNSFFFFLSQFLKMPTLTNILFNALIRSSSSEFVLPLPKYIKAVFHTRISVGMRFRMLFETEESSVRR